MTSREVWFVLPAGTLLLDLAGPAEVFRLAGGGHYRLHFAAAQPQLASSVGVQLAGLAALPDRLPQGALVLIPGCRSQADQPDDAALVHWLSGQRSAPVEWASVCAGAFFLGAAGLLEGRRCTTHFSLTAALASRYPQAQVEAERLFVQDGPVFTSAGISSGIDLALEIVARDCGPAVASEVARQAVLFFRRGSHDPQLSPWLMHRNHLHPGVQRAQQAMAERPELRWSSTQLAELAHVSPRQLQRLFAEHAGISPKNYLTMLRMARARQLLSQTGLPIERIAEACGYNSAREFRHAWAQQSALSPKAWRDTAQPEGGLTGQALT
ncbi:GlxA family transcriptional regulator [Chitinilyticum piscinae]|uniref:Helix-turn-helix domain-containing protein n=1 Tax=Chitinilyticum piscinae TaxID=2866724 RepID=A0A8J7K2U8_9NEIS|nr:helix-turn-helix domain-containing protein [Chitinilyticum piscinae]MBE9610522.1 helix-turn-helix domain-containing protein [Chitinilyticum piscinae]